MNDNQSGFPKYQYSLFLGEGKNAPQIVVRSNSFEEFKTMLDEIKTVQGTQPSQQAQRVNEPNRELVCAKCGAPARAKSGVSKKTGKPYSAVFCSSENPTHTTWS